MRILLILMILLAFPAMEVAVLVELAHRFGWWVLVYLLVTGFLGFLLIQDERMAVFGRMVFTLREGKHPLRALLATAKKLVAGVLFIFPGVMSDVLAILILLIPVSLFGVGKSEMVVETDVIEGEFRRDE